MINIDEYMLKKQHMDKQVLEMLADDSNDGTLYTLHTNNRETKIALDCGVFKHYSNLKNVIEGRIEFEEHANDGNYCASDFEWFDVKKYILSDGEYKQKMAVKIAFDYSLIHYYTEDNVIEERTLLEQEVAVPYESGDIIKIKNTPMSEDFYGIYIYDETQEGNKHIQITFDEKAYFCKIHWLEKIEKVIDSPDKRINDISKRIKEMNGNFSKVLKNYGIKMEIQAF